jgi:hypothetical protein
MAIVALNFILDTAEKRFDVQVTELVDLSVVVLALIMLPALLRRYRD